MKSSRIMCLIAVAALSMGATPLRYKGKPFLTYPMPPRPRPDDPLKIFPANHVPENPDRYTWKLAPPKFAAAISDVPVFLFDARLKPIKVGSLPLGTTVKLDQFLAHGKLNYYSVPWKGQLAWISGVFIVPSAIAPAGK